MIKKNSYPPPKRWPDAELPLPRVVLRKYDLSDDGWLVPVAGTLNWAHPPPELHLREFRETDIASPDSLRSLCQEAGEIVVPARPWLGVIGPGVFDQAARPDAEQVADELGAHLKLPAADWAHRTGGSLDHVHVREVALRVWWVRIFVMHATRVLDREAVAPLWQQLGVLDDETDPLRSSHERTAVAHGFKPLGDEEAEVVARARFATQLNNGLVELSPRLLDFHVESEPDLSDVTSAYAAACAMVFNDLRDQVPYKVCADETCGRLFRRQLGRSKGINKPRSTGVEFCTWSHARNQSRRARRREEREQREI